MLKVQQILGETLKDSELETMAKKLMARARQIRTERYGMTADEAVNTALREMQEETIALGRLKRRNTYLNIKAFTDMLGRIQTSWGDRPSDGQIASYIGSNILRRGAQLSIDADQKNLARNWHNGFGAKIERSDKRKLFNKGALDLDAYKAVDQMYKDNPDMTGIDRDGRELGEIVHEYQELYRTEANNAGAMIKRSPDYITHQTHDMFRVRNAAATLSKSLLDRLPFRKRDIEGNLNAWRDFTMPLLDAVKTFGGHADPKQWMEHFYGNIASGEHLIYGNPLSTGYVAEGSLASRLSEPRILHFKDAESRFKYDQMFARGRTLVERVGMGLEVGAHNVALMRRMGPNPSLTHQRLKQAVHLLSQQSLEGKLGLNWSYKEQMLDAHFDEITGLAHLPGRSPTATALRMLRFDQMLSKLGTATVSSITDLAVAASELRYQGFSQPDAWLTQLNGVFQGRGSHGAVRADRMRLASELGVAIDYLKSSTASRFSSLDGLPGWMARGQHWFFQHNMLIWWSDTQRMANAQAMSHKFGMMASRGSAELDAGMQRLFTLFDVKPEEWDLMRSRALTSVGGKEYFTPKGAEKITDAEISYLLQKEGIKPTERRIGERRQQIQTKFGDIFSARADYAIVVPGARTASIMRGANIGIKPGSTAAEMMRSVFQFKGFPLAILEKVYGREMFGYGPTGKVLDTPASGMAGLASFMAYSTILGFTAIYLKSYLSGRRIDPPQNKADAAKLFMAAFIQGGGAGLYGDFLFGQARDRFGHSALDAFIGPSWGAAVDAYSGVTSAGTKFSNLYNGMKNGDLNAGSLFASIKNNTPYINLFYTRIALDYMILFRLQEWADPGSLKRMEDSIKKSQNQSFALPPSSHYRIEDMTAKDLGTLLNPLSSGQ